MANKKRLGSGKERRTCLDVDVELLFAFRHVGYR